LLIGIVITLSCGGNDNCKVIDSSKFLDKSFPRGAFLQKQVIDKALGLIHEALPQALPQGFKALLIFW
jgi:hypothetical protein